LLRESEISELRDELNTLESTIETLEERVGTLGDQLAEHETRRETLQHSFNDAVRGLSDVKSVLLSNRQRHDQQVSRVSQLDEEIAEVKALSEQDASLLEQATSNRNESLRQLESMERRTRTRYPGRINAQLT